MDRYEAERMVSGAEARMRDEVGYLRNELERLRADLDAVVRENRQWRRDHFEEHGCMRYNV